MRYVDGIDDEIAQKLADRPPLSGRQLRDPVPYVRIEMDRCGALL
jgi:hypothetical protein